MQSISTLPGLQRAYVCKFICIQCKYICTHMAEFRAEGELVAEASADYIQIDESMARGGGGCGERAEPPGCVRSLRASIHSQSPATFASWKPSSATKNIALLYNNSFGSNPLKQKIVSYFTTATYRIAVVVVPYSSSSSTV